MFRVVVGQLRYRFGRTLSLLLGIAVAATSFSVLTGAAETTRLEVRGTVAKNFRSTYDLLVRPAGSFTEMETEQDLVRPNYQSGIFGGITTDQLAAIRAVGGVEVAAPVANLGYVDFGGPVTVPIKPYLDGDTQQLFRVRPTWTMDRGTSRFEGAPSYVYVSRNRTTVLGSVDYRRQGGYGTSRTYAEVVPGRRAPVPACDNYYQDKSSTAAEGTQTNGPFGYANRYGGTHHGPWMTCYYLDTKLPADPERPDGAFDPEHLDSTLWMPMPVLVTAIDPKSEAALWGLDRAVVAGRMLTPDDGPGVTADGQVSMPALISSTVDLDQQLSATVERLRSPQGRLLSDVLTGEDGVVDQLAALPGRPVGQFAPVEAAAVWARETRRKAGEPWGYSPDNYWSVGPSTYDQAPNGSLRVRPVQNPASVFASDQSPGDAPVGSDDSAVRPLTNHRNTSEQNFPGFTLVGTFDPSKAAGTGALSGLAAETYVSPSLPGADQASRTALGDQPLAPSSNLAGYAAQRPALLTTLDGAAPLLNARTYAGASSTAPISVVRVRVAGVEGPDPASRERLNLAATAIAERTGLAVDIVAGGSGAPRTVVLPAGDKGRPQLRLLETWTRKGVAFAVAEAVDRKSAALFLLILATCGLVVGNAAGATVRTRRTELGVLSALGWGRAQLFGVVLGELMTVGLAAGTLGTATALGLGRLTGQEIDVGRAGLAVPVAVALATLAGLSPALRAARATPVDAVRPLVWAPRRVRPVRSVLAMALASLARTPGRTGMAAASLGIAVFATSVLLAVQQQFRGQVVGTLLGDAVALQVRTPDLVALGAIGLLGAYAVADVLYLAVREQATELAVLRGIGWSGYALSRLVVGQGLGIGLLGSVLGAAAGVGIIAWFTSTWDLELLRTAAYAGTAGVLAALLAAVVPALVVRRLPIAALVSEEV